ncbi:hypothetical protein ACQ3I4_08985 [Zafaria sp. Z1313]|uniref:hypothetical protein n=1 Tax=unclassified Zafaria TaxID=2828765 RepID=UPI002E78B7B7|nr:hypothetical protein [Zafaria sp. J156]MEE1621663.1 hypothetical protein [Zafaria sp. J156]
MKAATPPPADLAVDAAPAPSRRSALRGLLRVLASVAVVGAGIALIYAAVDSRSALIAAQAPIRDAGLDPEFAELAVRSGVVVTTLGIALSYLVARGVEAIVVAQWRRRFPLSVRPRAVDLTTILAFGWAAFLDTHPVQLAAAAPGWVFLAVPALVLARQAIASRRAGWPGTGTTVLLAGALTALTLLAYGRWF